MASKKRILLLMLTIAALVTIAILFVVRYRIVRLENIEVVDSEVRAFLEKAADSLKTRSSSVRNTSLIVTTTENSICYDEDFPCVFNLSQGTGYVKVNGINVFLDRLILEDGIPVAFSKTNKHTLFLALSMDGYNYDLNRCYRGG